MSDATADFSMSTLSLNSCGSQNEDWDRSESDIQADSGLSDNKRTTTPRNSVVFPADGAERTPGRGVASKGERTLSELLKLHAEKGTEGRFSADEASRVAEVLGQWINSELSPYEAEDDFFSRSHDDSSISTKRSPSSPLDSNGRPRGQSESMVNYRPAIAADGVKT
ncbi:hypothetical protein PILCRDRAFT_817086 [Piloderma croceum F 1598]|uniref:Uncharacterized protein n=1 Tax=Piloderma croceum (strain F 1598) TaxID=765440 RepID=A0A0C3FPB4_PILCF|nr:hypothetical protein PILCRDRAFT_817086 [Piloderma croceum F 1598]